MRRPLELEARRALAVGVAGLGLVLVAAVFDAGPLFVPGVALVAISVLAPVWVLWSARGARIRRLPCADRVTEGAGLTTTLEVHRPRAPDGWGRLEIVDPASGTCAGLGGPGSPLRRARVGHVRVVVGCPRRGERSLPAPSLIARDPLELARARCPGEGAAPTVLVLPRTEPVRWQGGAGGARLADGGAEGRSEALAATDLEGLRSYRPGTPASRIHWPALARGRGLIERRLQADADRRPLIVLDTRTRDRDPAPLDAAVRAAASLALALAAGGGCSLLLPGDARVTAIDAALSAWPAAHARLAVAGTAADPHADRPPGLAAAAGRGGTLIYVAAVCHERFAAALSSRGGRGGIVLVVPDSEVVDGRPRGAPGRALPALAVSGCRGFALGLGRIAADPAGSGPAAQPATGASG